jgi:hypothetical protein
MVRLGTLVAAGVLALGVTPAALAAPTGNANAGDVWVDNLGQPSGPGHEQDPHLACSDINLWGSGLADSTESYTIDGWAPSGSQEQDYASTWTYHQTTGGSQVIDVISVKTLIANAVAHGDAPVNKQGFHFKLQLTQDPQKHKTFWVNCPAPSGSGGGTHPGTSGGNGGTPPPAGTPGTTPSTPPSGTDSPAPKTAVKAAHQKRRHHKLVRPKRHLKARKAVRSHVKDAAPTFTG